MSRGPGVLQRGILRLAATTPDPKTANDICWRLAQETGRLDAEGSLDPRYYKAFRRALGDIGDPLTFSHRPLKDISEILVHYPNRTLSGPVRQIRIHLLPILLDGEQYQNASARELATRDRLGLPSNQTTKDWQRLEAELVEHMAHDSVLIPAVGNLIARGRQLFSSNSGASHAQSFSVILDTADNIAQRPCCRACLAKIRRFLERSLPESERLREDLKSQLRAFTVMSRDSRPRLREEAKAKLLDARSDIVTKLPGYRIHRDHGSGLETPVHSDLLDQLILTDVLKAFEFVEGAP